MSRKYLPTFSDLVDRLSIVQLKSIFIPGNKEAYDDEITLIMHDIDLLLRDKFNTEHWSPNASDIRAIMMIMLANRYIWENESKARQGGSEQNDMLRFTHAVNGVRNTAKNILAHHIGERQDLKVDCLAADLPEEMGNWRVFDAHTV